MSSALVSTITLAHSRESARSLATHFQVRASEVRLGELERLSIGWRSAWFLASTIWRASSLVACPDWCVFVSWNPRNKRFGVASAVNEAVACPCISGSVVKGDLFKGRENPNLRLDMRDGSRF